MPLNCHSGVNGEESEPYTHNQWQTDPPAEDGTFKYPGMTVRVHSSNDDARSSLRGSSQQMLTAIDKTPLTHQQKLHLFKHGVCPWPVHVEDFPITWLERDLQPLATKAFKEWAGFSHHANTSILFFSSQEGWSGSDFSG